MVTGTWLLWLSIQLGMSSSQLTFIFFRWVETTEPGLFCVSFMEKPQEKHGCFWMVFFWCVGISISGHVQYYVGTIFMNGKPWWLGINWTLYTYITYTRIFRQSYLQHDTFSKWFLGFNLPWPMGMFQPCCLTLYR